MPCRSEPAPGSVIAIAAIVVAGARARGTSAASARRSRSRRGRGRSCRCSSGNAAAVDPAPGHLLGEHDVVAEVAAPAAAVLLVELKHEQALRAGLAPRPRGRRCRPSPTARGRARPPCRGRCPTVVAEVLVLLLEDRRALMATCSGLSRAMLGSWQCSVGTVCSARRASTAGPMSASGSRGGRSSAGGGTACGAGGANRSSRARAAAAPRRPRRRTSAGCRGMPSASRSGSSISAIVTRRAQRPAAATARSRGRSGCVASVTRVLAGVNANRSRS